MPRMIAYLVLYNYGYKIKDISKHFNRDHGAIGSGINRIKELAGVDSKVDHAIKLALRFDIIK